MACTSRHSFKGPSSHPEVAFKFIDRKLICKQKYFHKNPYFWEDGASYRLQRQPGKECILAGNTSDGEGSLG